MSQNGDMLTCTGSDYMGSIVIPTGTTLGVGSEVWGMYLSMASLRNTRLGAFANLYERYKFKKVTIRINGSQSATAQDQLIASYDADPSDYVPTGDEALHVAMAQTNSGVFKSWENATLSIPAHRMDKWLFTNKGSQLAAGTSTDQRLYAAGYVSVTNVSTIVTAANYSLASVWIEYAVEFDIPQLQRDSPSTAFVQSAYPVNAGNLFLSGQDVLQVAKTAGAPLEVFVANSEHAAEAKPDATSTAVVLQAGKYMFTFDLASFTDTTYATLYDVLSNSLGADGRVTLNPYAVPLQGSGNPLANPVNARTGVSSNTFKQPMVSAKGYFELLQESAVSWFWNVSTLAVSNAAKILQTVVVHEVLAPLHKGFARGIVGSPIEVKRITNYPVGYITDGRAYMYWDDAEAPPTGWTFVSNKPAAVPRGSFGARKAVEDWTADDVDPDECEVMSKASSAKGYAGARVVRKT